MASKDKRTVDVSKLAGNFTIDDGVKTFFIRADCSKCFKWECVASYPQDVADREFTVDYYECLNCDKVVCGICVKEHANTELACPLCGKKELKKLTPKKILECHTCITESELACPVCEYLD